MVFGKEFFVQSGGFSDIKNITDEVISIVKESEIKEGIINIFSIGSTGSISTLEFEPFLVEDMQEKLEELVPHNQPSKHSARWGDDNGFSHMRATLMGPNITVPLHLGTPVLGTWQQIVLIDHFNSPRERRVFVQIVGE